MSVQSITNTSSAASAATTSKSATSMGKDDFLKILMAQLQNQDPLNPQDPSQFVSELSQLSSVESLKNIESSLSTLNSTVARSNTGQWVSAIGDYMQVSSASISNGDKIVLSPSSTSSYDSLTLTLKSKADGTTTTKTFSSTDTPVYVDQDTTDYAIVGAATVSGGKSTSCDYAVYRVIRGVQSDSSGTLLVSGDGTTYAPSSVKLIFK
jgi:flagellar basal-body rod modification protein FlgD